MAKTLLKLKQLEALANNNRALVSDGNGQITESLVTTTELEYLDLTAFGTANNNEALVIDNSGNLNMNDKTLTGVDIDSGAIDGTAIGANSRSSIACTTLDANGNVVLGDNTGDSITITGRIANGSVQPVNTAQVSLGHADRSFSELHVDDLEINGKQISVRDAGANSDITLAPKGTGSVVMGKVDIGGGEIDGAVIGANTAAAGSFTTISASTSLQLPKEGGGTLTVSTIEDDLQSASASHNSLASAKAIFDAINAKAAGLRWMKPVEVATTGELNTNAAGVQYVDNDNALRRNGNGQLGNIDGEPIEFNNDEDQATRILVKDQAGTKGFLQFSVDGVPTNGQNMTFEINDVYYQINFVDGSESGNWGGGNGQNSGARKTFDVKRNDPGESESTIASSIRSAFLQEFELDATGTNEVVRIEQKDPKDQAVTNNVAGTASTDNESQGAGVSSRNGIYYAYADGDGSSPWELRRASDAIDINELSAAAVFVERGITNSDQGYVQSSDFGPGEDIDDAHQQWNQFTGTGAITAEAGLEKSGNIIRMDIENALTSISPAVGDFVALGDESAASGSMGRGTVGGILDLIAGDVAVDSAGASTISADAVGRNEVDMIEISVNITNASNEHSDNFALATADQAAATSILNAPLTQVFFNGLRLRKASDVDNSKNPGGDGDYHIQRVDGSNCRITFTDADFANGEDFDVVIIRS